MKKIMSIILVLTLASGLLSGCGARSEVDGMLNVAISNTVGTLNTALMYDSVSLEITSCLVEGLTQLDDNNKVVPSMAESWDISDDGLVYTFHLRDACWSNGSPVTADDFVFGWQLLMSSGGTYSSFPADSANVAGAYEVAYLGADISTLGISAPDEHTFRVELSSPVAFFLSLMNFCPFYPINREFYESCEPGMYGTGPKFFISNGPFVLENYIPGTSTIRVIKNEKYWDADNIKLPGIKFQVAGSSDTSLAAFRAGALDVCSIGGSQLVEAKSDTELAPLLAVMYKGGLSYLSINVSEGELSNKNLRLAITNAIDRQSIINNILGDGSQPASDSVARGFAFNSITGEDFVCDAYSNTDVCSFQPDVALAYYELAKQELGKDSFHIELLLYGSAAKVMQAIKEQLEARLPGLELTLVSSTFSEETSRLKNHDFQMGYTGWYPDYCDPLTFSDMWCSDSANNHGQWENAEYNALVNSAKDGTYVNDYAGRWEALHRANRIVMEEAVIVPLYNIASVYLIAPNVSGIFYPAGCPASYKYAVKTVN